MAPIIFVLVTLTLIFIVKAQKIVKENHRMLILRLGKFYDLKSPGFHIIVPFIDQAEDLDLQKELPGFKGMSSEQIGDQIVEKRFGKAVLEEWVRNNRKPWLTN